MWIQTVISGEQRGWAAAAVRGILRGLGQGYGGIIRLRNQLYEKGFLPVTALSVPVVCVGNLTTGGTGKTPMVVWVCEQLQRQGRKVALLSRGYKGDKTGNDEVAWLRERLGKEVNVVVDADRRRGGRRAIREFKAEVLVLDDGFQHRGLGRDLDIVLIDCTCPFGYGALLPAGRLREPVGELRRADAAVLTRCDLVTPEKVRQLTKQVRNLLGTAEGNRPKPIAWCRHQPVGLINNKGDTADIERLRGEKVFAFCGIGNPQSFAATLRQRGAQLMGQRFFNDHHCYRNDDLVRLRRQGQNCGAKWWVTTAKDWVKLRRLQEMEKMELWRLPIEIAWDQGREQFQALLKQMVDGKRCTSDC